MNPKAVLFWIVAALFGYCLAGPNGAVVGATSASVLSLCASIPMVGKWVGLAAALGIIAAYNLGAFAGLS